jgi:hypothetical protein
MCHRSFQKRHPDPEKMIKKTFGKEAVTQESTTEKRDTQKL